MKVQDSKKLLFAIFFLIFTTTSIVSGLSKETELTLAKLRQSTNKPISKSNSKNINNFGQTQRLKKGSSKELVLKVLGNPESVKVHGKITIFKYGEKVVFLKGKKLFNWAGYGGNDPRFFNNPLEEKFNLKIDEEIIKIDDQYFKQEAFIVKRSDFSSKYDLEKYREAISWKDYEEASKFPKKNSQASRKALSLMQNRLRIKNTKIAIGNTRQKVIEILGKPNSETKKSLKFGKTGVVYLNNNLVINWTGFPKDCSKFDNESKKLYASAVKRTKEIIKKQNLKKQTRSLSFASSVEKHIREFAARKYPNNSRMQSYVYKEQLSAYNYLKTVNDNEIKNFAIRKYPNDFSMQKYTYDKQLAAKNYMKRVSNYDAKKQAVRKYPLDYSMQKYIYDRLAY